MDEDSLPIEGDEKRQDRRVFCDVTVILNDAANSIKADSIDISENGFRLVGEQSFSLGKGYELVFTLDDDASDISCVATVIWADQVPSHGKFSSGFRFSNLSVDDRIKLRRYIQKQKNSR